MSGKVTGAGGKGYSAECTIEGLPGTLAALKAFEPTILKEMNREIRGVMNVLKGAAEGKYSATGGSGGYVIRSSTRGKKAGMKVTAAMSGGESGSEWSSSGRLSAILEFYGKTSAKCPQAITCTMTLNSRYGQPGRFLWDSWDAQKGSAIPAIEAAVHKAEAQLQESLDAQGIAY